MNFELSEQQEHVQETYRRFLADNYPVARMRELHDAAEIDELWTALAELGTTGVLVPEEFGGVGLSSLEAALIAAELARAAAPTPFLGAAVLAPVAFCKGATSQQQQEWLPRIAGGEVRIGAALAEAYAPLKDSGVAFAGGKLNGVSLFAIDMTGADAALVATAGERLFLVNASDPGLSVELLTTIDRARDISELRFENVAPLFEFEQGALEAVMNAGRAVLAGDILGSCERMLDMAVAYAKEREQFGRVIGSFQAVKHMCAAVAAQIEDSRALMWYAAHALDHLPDEASKMARHAKAHVSDVGREIADVTVQVHGGIGFTYEYNLHLWYKRIGVSRELLGNSDLLREQIAELEGFIARAAC